MKAREGGERRKERRKLGRVRKGGKGEREGKSSRPPPLAWMTDCRRGWLAGWPTEALAGEPERDWKRDCTRLRD